MGTQAKGDTPGYMVLNAGDYVMTVCARCAGSLRPGDYVTVGCCEAHGLRTRDWSLRDPSEGLLGLGPGYGTVCPLCGGEF